MKNLAEPATRQSVLQRIARLDPGAKPRWGRMSAHQMLCHLTDSYRAPLGEKHVSPAPGWMRWKLIKWIARFADPGRAFAWHPHPLLGAMRDSEWQRWGYLHADHHLRQFGV